MADNKIHKIQITLPNGKQQWVTIPDYKANQSKAYANAKIRMVDKEGNEYDVERSSLSKARELGLRAFIFADNPPQQKTTAPASKPKATAPTTQPKSVVAQQAVNFTHKHAQPYQPTWQEQAGMSMAVDQAASMGSSDVQPMVKPGLDTNILNQNNALANRAMATNLESNQDNLYLDELEKKANELAKQGMAEANAKESEKPFSQRVFENMNSTTKAGYTSTPYTREVENNEKIRQANLIQTNVRDARKAIKDAEISQDGSWYQKLGRGLANGVDVRNFDFGITKLRNSMTLLSAANNPNDINNAILDSEALKNKIIKENEDKINDWIKAGETTTIMVPFMIQIASTPFKGLGTAASKWVMGKVGQEIAGSLGKRAALLALKGTTRFLGDTVEGAGTAAFFNTAGITADAMRRQRGNAVGQYGSDGYFHYNEMKDGEDSYAKAFAKAFGASAIEYQSELVGEYFSPLLKGIGKVAGKGLQKAGVLGVKEGFDTTGKKFTNIMLNFGGKNVSLDKTIGMITALSNKQYLKAFNDFTKATRWNGVIGEYAEEVVGNIENAALVGDMNWGTGKDGVFNPEQNWETFLSVAVGSGFMGAIGGGFYMGSRLAVNRGLKKSDKKGMELFGADAWRSIKDGFETADNPARFLAAISQNLDEPSKRAIQNYAAYSMAKKGELVADMKQRMEEPQPTNVRITPYKGRFVVQSVDSNGNIIESKDYDSEEDANIYKERVATYIDNARKVQAYNDFILRDDTEKLFEQLGIDNDTYALLQKIAYKDPLKRTDAEQEFFDNFINSTENITYPTNEVHEEHDAQKGADLAEETSENIVEGAKPLNDREAAAKTRWNAVVQSQPDIDSLVGTMVNQGMTSNEIAQRLVDDYGGESEVVEAFCELCNAKANKDGYINRIGQLIQSKVENDIDEASFAGTVNGNKDKSNIYLLTNGTNSFALIGGDITVDSNNNISSNGIAIMLDGQGNRMTRPDLTGFSLKGIVDKNQYKRSSLLELQQEATAAIQATEIPIQLFNNSDIDTLSPEMPNNNGLTAPEVPQQEQPQEQPQAQAEEQPQEQPATPENTSPIPLDEKGKRLYHKAPIEATINDLYDGALEDEEIRDFVQNNINKSAKDYDKAIKKKPDTGTDKDAYLQAKQAWQQQVDEAKQKLDYWNSVNDYIQQQTHTTPEEIQKAQDELSGKTAQQEYAKNKPDMSVTPVQFAGEFIRESKIQTQSFYNETGFGDAERKKFPKMIANDGKTIDSLAGELVSADDTYHNGSLYHGDTTEAKNAILEALQTASKKSELGKNTSDDFKEYERQREEAREAFYEENFNMPYSDYLAFEEQQMPNIWRRMSNFVAEEYDRIVNESYELRDEQNNVEQINNENNENNTEGNQQLAGGSEVLPTEGSNQQGGTSTSTNPAAETTNGSEGSNQNEEIPGDSRFGRKAPEQDRAKDKENDQRGLENRDKGLFPDTFEVYNVKGTISSFNGNTAIYTDQNGRPSIILSAVNDSTYVGFFFDPETKKWSSKMENSSDKETFKSLIKEATDSLPEGAELIERTNVSVDGLRVLAQQLKHGWQATGETYQCGVNAEDKNNLLGEDHRGNGNFDSVYIRRGELEKMRDIFEPYLKSLGMTRNDLNINEDGKLVINLPVLKKTTENANTDNRQKPQEEDTQGVGQNNEPQKKNSASDNTTDTDETVNNGKLNDTATQQNTVSDNKDTTKSPNSQENQQKTDEKVEERQNEEVPQQLTEADIDADEIADEYSKELAKDFLRGENTGTIAELFYREIAGRAQKKGGKKEEKKPSDTKPSSTPPTGQAESNKPKSEPNEKKPKADTPKASEQKNSLQQALDEFKDVMRQFRDAGRMDASVSLVGLNSRQIEMLGKVFRATAKLGYEIIKKGATSFENWLETMKAQVADIIKVNSNWNDQDITDLLTEAWNNKYPVDGVYKPLSQWAAEEALAAEQKQEEQKQEAEQPAETPEAPAAEQTKVAERKFVDNVATTLTSAMETGEKPYASIVALRKAAREAGMEVGENGETDIKIQELVEDALVRVAKNIMTSAHIAQVANKANNKFAKEIFEKIKLLYNLQPTISMRSSNRIALQQYSTPLPMAFVADMFATGAKAPLFFNVFEPTAGNGMLVFAIPSSQVHVNEIDENRLDNLRGQEFRQVTSQDATQPFAGDRKYNAIITNPPFGSTEAKDYDGYSISGLAPQIALNALDKMKDNGKAVIIIGGKQEFAPNGAIKNDKPFLAYLYNNYNVKGVIDMDGSLYAKQGTTFPTRMILIDGRRTEEERAKSNIYPPTIKNWINPVADFDRLYDTVNDLINSKEKTNGTEIVHAKDESLQSDRSVTLPGNTDKGTDSRKPVQDVATTGRGLGPNRGNGKSPKRDNPELDLFGGVLGGSGGLSDNPENESGTGGGSGRRTGRDNGPGGKGVDNRLPVDNLVSGVQGTATRGVGLTQEQENRKLDSEKLPYRPHNGAFSLESLAPAAMVEAMDKTLKRIEEEYGNIDEFVTNELGYDSIDAMHKALAAEQVDSVAMAIYNMKKGEALIIGDQTGVGKGRQMAALIRWAHRQGKKPIFMTQKSNLFNDIYRDLKDIGSESLKPFIFNDDSDAKIVEIYENDNGDEKQKIIYRSASKEEINKALKSGKIPDDCDFVLCTYSQISTGDETSKEYETQLSKEEGGSKRRRSRKQNSDAKPKSDKKAILLRKLAKDNYLMLDESHTAAGESNQGFYMQTLVRDSKAVTFASATYAKRPDTMPLYALRTAMSKANIGMKKLIEAIQKGGVTLQEIMSRALTNSGQMVRRERDMEGVVTDWTTIDDPETVKKARENYDKTIKAFNAIIDFQNKYIEPVINNKREDLAVIAGNAGFVKGTEKMGINNTPFASKTYNYTKQLMLALKVDAIVDEVDRQIKAGRKPVIALDNTMGALFDKLTPGDEVNESTFAENLLRGLDSVMQYSQDSGKGRKKTSIKISPSELGTEGEAAYYELVSFIKESTKDIFISPLDEITAKLRAKGYNVGELTGRKNVVVEDNGTYRIAKRGKISKQLLQSRFNSGKIDVVILNKTGSTGISLHASKTFADQRQRVMILAQPLPDINDYMQMIGRIDRTGQVKRGYYINLGLPVPAEQRFLMMLSTKLKSLNANTTTSQESKDNKVEAPDMLNKYGSQVIVEYFKDHPDIYNKLDDPLNVKNKDGGLSGYKPSYDDEDARKLTGQVALLSTDEQQAFYDDVIERYNNLIKYLDDSGTNDLKITSLPLNATTLARAVSSEGNDPTGDNPFAQNAYVEKVEMDVLRKPMKANEINNVINTIAKGKDPKQAVEDIKAQYETEFKAKLDKQKRKYEADLERNKETLKKYEDKINGSEKMSEEDKRKAIDDKKESLQQDSDRKNDNAISSLEYEHERMTKALDLFKVGGSYLIPDNLDTLAFDLTSHGIFLGYKAKDNGITPSSTIAVFATLDGRRRVEIKLSEGNKIANVNTTTNQNYDAAQQVNLTNWDNNIPNITRKTGYIITGNILQAINDSQDENGNFTGQLVSYTDSEGNIHDGVLMPDKWEPTMMVNAGNPISSAKADIESGKTVISINGEVEIVPVISRYNPTAIYLRVPRSKKLGAKYYENEDLIRAIDEKEFYQNSGKLQTAIPNGKLDEVLSVLSKMGVKVPSDIVKQLSPQQSDGALAKGLDVDNSLRYRKALETTKTQKASAKTQQRMREKAKSLAKSLNIPVKIVTSDKASEEAKNAKGYYDTRTGEVVIVLDNNQSVLDIEKTVVHEIIGHHGLRGLLGSVRNYRQLMNVIYDSLPEKIKNEIKDKAMRNGYKFYEAMDEYFAEQAENMVWDSSSATMWDNIKHYITEAIRKLGFILRPNYRDVRYWLWLSKNNLQSDNPLSEIKRQAFLHKLSRLHAPKFDDNFNKTEGDINYTDVDTAFRNGNIQGGTAWQIIEQRLKDNKQYWKESFVDYMNSYRIFQEEMAKGIEGGLMDNMNAYLGENQMSSKVAELQDQFLNNEVKNLQKQIDELKTEFGKGEEGVRALEQYLIMKHGLERNRVLFVRDWFNNNIRKTVTESDLPEEAKLILENKQIDIETRFEDGDITEEQRDKLLKQAPQEAWEEYVNDKFNKFTALHSQLAADVDRGLISLQDMYTRLDANINSFADFDPNNNDKSGLSAMTEYFVDDNYSDDAIVQQAMSIDEMLGDRKTNLWNAVEAVTQKGLDYDFMSGIVGEEAYNRAKTMFRWYIPLRGMDQKTMEDQYTYIQNSSGIGKKSLVTAKGRTTLAKSPLSTATQMGLSAISRGERNINKQRAYRLVNRWLKENENEMPPATIVDVWYEITGTDINGNPKMEIAIPPITDDMNDEQIRATVAIFNQRMKDLKRQGLAMNNKIPVEHMRPFDSKNHKSEHIVFVNINGKQKMIVFNGNPRPAQALNGDLNPSNSDNLFKKLMRIMAAAFTSYNPTFLATNLSRDILFSNSNVSIKEGKNYWLKFTKNQSMLLGNFATKYRKLWKDYNNGVQPTTDMGRYFEEFMKNGGKTGFVNQKKIDELQRMLYNNDKKEFAAKSLSMVFDFIENMNDRVENMNRFAAYVTSREMGRSVMRSINDAKEVSVNFNRKGAGSSTAKGENVTPAAKLAGSVGGAFRSSYLFFNAGIQSFYTLARNIENHPFKTSAYAMAVPFIAGSFLVPMLNKIIGLIFGDDGDDEYANIPEWTRRNNICIYLTNGNWAKIPLPIELRAFYGLGDIAAGYTIDERLQSTQNLGIDITSQLSQILPVDFMGEGGNVLVAFVPDVIKPVVQIMTNTDWTGKPIQKATTPFNKYDPEYTKAFKYEFEPFVKLSKNINKLTGGTDVTKGWYDGWWNSPAYWNHLIGGYGGGFVQDIMRTAKTSERLLTKDFDEWSIKEIPILKALFETPTERTQYYRTMNKFQMYRDEAAKSKHDLNKWRKSEDPLLKARFIHDTNKATKPNYVKRMELVDKYLRFENRANKIIDSPRVEEVVKKAKKEELTKAKIELVKKLDELE